MKLNLGCGLWGTLDLPWPDQRQANFDFGGPLPGWVNVDHHEPPGLVAEHQFVLWDLNARPWPFEAETAEEVRAYHILEHLEDWLAAMREIHRIARAGARVDIVVPYAGTVGDVANPYHRHHFNHQTFAHLCCGVAATNDLDMAWRPFWMERQFLREKGQEQFEDFSWRLANLEVILRVVK